jgi:nucleoside-diphosphate kinase
VSTQQTLVLIKPDALKKGIAGEVIDRIMRAKLRIVGAKVKKVSKEMAVEHYKHLKDQPFFDELIRFITGGIHGEEYAGILAFVVEGDDAIAKIRELAGATHPEKADSMSLRGAFGRITTAGVMENVLHASSDPAEAEREIKLWFSPSEILKPRFKTASSNHQKPATVWA